MIVWHLEAQNKQYHEQMTHESIPILQKKRKEREKKLVAETLVTQ